MSLINTFVLLGTVYLTKGIDFEIDGRMLMLRAMWVGMQLLTLSVFAYLYTRIVAAKASPEAKKTLVVPKKPSISDPQPQGADTMTVHEYDIAQLKEAVQGIVVQFVLILAIHYYWAATMPLITTSVMSIQRLLENKLVKLYLLGSTGPELQRPFKADENPFAALMKGATDQPAAATAAAAPAAAAVPAAVKSPKAKKVD